MMRDDFIIIRGKEYSKKDILKTIPDFAIQNDFGFQLYEFLLRWFNDSPYITVSTSGSTGIPKEIIVEKNKMINSAIATCDFLELNSNMTSLLCLSLSSIGGMMMVVRSIVRRLDLFFVEPSGNPLSNVLHNIDFVAMVPLQVHNLIYSQEGRNKILSINKLIIGGAAISDYLRDSLKYFDNEIYSTYGMTETLSHIALRKLSSKNATEFYSPLQNVHINLDERNCLVIDAPKVSDTIIKTNDIAEINVDGNFKIIGRYDNIINTGGIKVQIENLENKIQRLFDFDIAITSKPDDKFGNAIILLSEEKITNIDFHKYLEKHEIPKFIIENIAIPKTHTGKIDRVKCKEIAKEIED